MNIPATLGGYTAVPSFLQDSDTAVSAVDHSGQAYACPCKEGRSYFDAVIDRLMTYTI